VAAQLAHHNALAGSRTEAQRWATVAGDFAIQQPSPADAAYWYRVALEHATAVGASEQVRADLLARLGYAQRRANDPEAITTLTGGALPPRFRST